MILQLNPTIDVKTPLGDCEAMFLIDYGLNTNTVWCCRMPGGGVKHFYSDDIKVYDNPMNRKGWDIEEKIKWKKAPRFNNESELNELDRKSYENTKKIMTDTAPKESYLKNFMSNWPPSVETASYNWDEPTAQKFEGPIGRFPENDPPGKWSLPPDHPDSGGALIGQDKEKWEKIYKVDYLDMLLKFEDYLDRYYEPPKRFNLDSWAKVQKWYKGLVCNNDASFLDFLIKYYPAPDPKK